MLDKTTSNQKINSIKKNYNLIAKQYSNEFGIHIKDLNVYEKFKQYLVINAKILDLGVGSGRTYSFL